MIYPFTRRAVYLPIGSSWLGLVAAISLAISPGVLAQTHVAASARWIWGQDHYYVNWGDTANWSQKNPLDPVVPNNVILPSGGLSWFSVTIPPVPGGGDGIVQISNNIGVGSLSLGVGISLTASGVAFTSAKTTMSNVGPDGIFAYGFAATDSGTIDLGNFTNFTSQPKNAPGTLSNANLYADGSNGSATVRFNNPGIATLNHCRIWLLNNGGLLTADSHDALQSLRLIKGESSLELGSSNVTISGPVTIEEGSQLRVNDGTGSSGQVTLSGGLTNQQSGVFKGGYLEVSQLNGTGYTTTLSYKDAHIITNSGQIFLTGEGAGLLDLDGNDALRDLASNTQFMGFGDGYHLVTSATLTNSNSINLDKFGSFPAPKITAAGGLVNLRNAQILVSGGGTIEGNLTSEGTIELGFETRTPQASTLASITGDLTLLDGTVKLEIGVGFLSKLNVTGTAHLGDINVSGMAHSGGKLEAVFDENRTSADSAESFLVLEAGALTGALASNRAQVSTSYPSIRVGSFAIQQVNVGPRVGLALTDFVPVPRVIAGVVKGDAVTGAATQTYSSFGVPGPGPFAGVFQSGTLKVPAIFAADGSVLVYVGGTVDDIPNSKITKLGAPSGQAVLATLLPLQGLVTAKDNVVLLAGLADGSVRVAARMNGDTDLAGVKIKSFGAVDGNGSVVFFLAQLQGSDVTPQNATALCAARPDGTVQVLVRVGDTIGTKTVSILATLVAVKGSTAEGRWRAGEDSVGARLTFAEDKGQALYTFTSGATVTQTVWAATTDTLAAPLNTRTIGSFGFPAFGPGGVAFVANLLLKQGTVTKADGTALFETHGAGFNLLARTGGSVLGGDGNALAGVTFKTLADPVAGANGRVAFLGTLAGTGVKAANQTGIWFHNGSQLKMIARLGDEAEGDVDTSYYRHGHWTAFTSVALPDGTTGPLFTGTLAVDKILTLAAKSFVGLWGLDHTDSVRLLVHSGQSITFPTGLKMLQSFTALVPAAGAAGAASGYDNEGHVTALGTFTDHSQALINLTIP